MSKANLFDLSGKVSLITGGSSGLGRVFCEAMAESGSNVAFSYNTNEVGAKETEDMIAKYRVKTLALKADVSKPEEIRLMFRKVDREFGKLDILFNNAGIDYPPRRIHELPLEDWNKLIAIDLTGVFLCMQEGIKLMLRQKRGSIINISSICGLMGINPAILDNCSYVTAKHGIIGLTKQVALEYATDGIRVNALAPAFFPTRIARDVVMSEEQTRDFVKKSAASIPMKRWGELAELKGIAIYLASDASSFVTGATFAIDGGFTAW
jgi:NAD(P)-dependent dehydrogenase (short-subunit alcohol dehydrogenase family)